MPVTSAEAAEFQQFFTAVVDEISRAVRGKREQIELALICLFARGHLLIEDSPGVGKTLLARSLAEVLSVDCKRIQCTPDLLPSDITGNSIFNQRTQEFDFHEGPVFAHVVIADELNRTSPKSQSALLEVMEERQVTVDRETRRLEEPFIVIATQNPTDFESTYELPEAQLDRFLLKLSMGYPDESAELAILRSHRLGDDAPALRPMITPDEYRRLSGICGRVYVHDEVDLHIVRLLDHSRNGMSDVLARGASPRAGVALLRAAQVRALAGGRSMVLPEDVRTLAEPVLAHRLVVDPQQELTGVGGGETVRRLLDEVAPPVTVNGYR